MSHRLFLGSIFSNARVWAFLKQVDEAVQILAALDRDSYDT